MKRARSSNSCWRNAIADNQQCDNNICRFKPIVTHERSAGSAPLTIFSSHTLSDRTHSENTKQNDKHKKKQNPSGALFLITIPTFTIPFQYSYL